LDGLPWVDRVTVTRRWPDTVEVRIVEREAVAVAVAPDGERLAVTRDGMVAGPALSLDEELPTLGLDPTVPPVVGRRLPDRIALAVQMVGALPESIASRSNGSRIDADGQVEVDLGLGAVLVLGDGEDAAAKFTVAETLLGGTVSTNCLQKVDVSVPSASVVVRADGCR
jgi:cell division protein FtsQ